MFKFKKDRKGFTLIEVLLVLVIIGVLAAIAIPRFMTSKHDAEVKACDSQVSLLRTQLEKYYFDNNAYPGAAGDVLLPAAFLTSNYFPNGASDTCPVTPTGAQVAEQYTYSFAAGTVVCPKTNH